MKATDLRTSLPPVVRSWNWKQRLVKARGVPAQRQFVIEVEDESNEESESWESQISGSASEEEVPKYPPLHRDSLPFKLLLTTMRQRAWERKRRGLHKDAWSSALWVCALLINTMVAGGLDYYSCEYMSDCAVERFLRVDIVLVVAVTGLVLFLVSIARRRWVVTSVIWSSLFFLVVEFTIVLFRLSSLQQTQTSDKEVTDASWAWRLAPLSRFYLCFHFVTSFYELVHTQYVEWTVNRIQKSTILRKSFFYEDSMAIRTAQRVWMRVPGLGEAVPAVYCDGSWLSGAAYLGMRLTACHDVKLRRKYIETHPRRNNFQFVAQQTEDGELNGFCYWNDISQHGEIFRGNMDRGKPCGPFHSLLNATQSHTKCCVIGYVDMRPTTSDTEGERYEVKAGLAHVETFISGDWFKGYPNCTLRERCLKSSRLKRMNLQLNKQFGVLSKAILSPIRSESRRDKAFGCMDEGSFAVPYDPKKPKTLRGVRGDQMVETMTSGRKSGLSNAEFLACIDLSDVIVRRGRGRIHVHEVSDDSDMGEWVEIPPPKEIGIIRRPTVTINGDDSHHQLEEGDGTVTDSVSTSFGSLYQSVLSIRTKLINSKFPFRLGVRGCVREVVLYVHGMNNTLLEAGKTLGQLFAMGDFPSNYEFFLFSWPSCYSIWEYHKSKNRAINDTDIHRGLISLLRLLKVSGVGKVHLITHSMGTRLAIHALTPVIRDGHLLKRSSDNYNANKQLELASLTIFNACFDIECFVHDYYTVLRSVCPLITVYTNSNDKALKGAVFSERWRHQMVGRSGYGFRKIRAEPDKQKPYVPPAVRKAMSFNKLNLTKLRSVVSGNHRMTGQWTVVDGECIDDDENWKPRVRIHSQAGSAERDEWTELFGKTVKDKLEHWSPIPERLKDDSVHWHGAKIRRRVRQGMMAPLRPGEFTWLDLDVIDTSNVQGNIDTVQHSYFSINRSIVEDLHQLLTTQVRARERPRLINTLGNVYVFVNAPLFLTSWS